MYRDVSGLFTNKIPDEFTSIPQHIISDTEPRQDNENEDDLLYGDDSDFKMPAISTSKPKVYYNWWKKYMKDNKPTFWLFVVRENSNLEIYSVPEFKLCFIARNLNYGYKVLVDSLESVNTIHDDKPEFDEHVVKEICVVALGNKNSKPLLFVRLENDLYIYEVFRFHRGNLKMRFKKMQHNIMYSSNETPKYESGNADFIGIQEKISKIRYFTNIAGYSGLFICGANPYWIFLTSRGELRAHNMLIDGEVLTFAAFNNINCPLGFLYFNKKVIVFQDHKNNVINFVNYLILV